MALYIVQHGKSLAKDVDPERGISEEGKKQTTLIANVAKGYNVHVADIWHSGKKRALQTAEIFESVLNINGKLVEKTGLNPMDDVASFAQNLAAPNTMLVGHLPFLEKMISYLITGSENFGIFKLQNSGIVCMDQQETQGPWSIKWALMPQIS